MLGTTIENHQTAPFDSSSQLFRGIRFVLLGFDPINKSQVSRKLVNGGAVDAGQYGPNCTHVIVDKLVYDDPVCVATRQDGKILVSSLWLDHSFEIGAPLDTTSVMYRPVRDLNGISGAKSLVICLTGYQREDRLDIMTMVELMGAQFSKPLIANKVTHLICYKFEGEKYLLAKKMKTIKLINHQWLEDCLKNWEILPEADYSKSGYELEMEAEAKDSEELEGATARHNETKIATPPRSLLSNQEVPKTLLNTSASKVFSNSIKIINKHLDTQNVNDVTFASSNLCEKNVGGLSAQNKISSASMLANKSPQNEGRNVISATRSTPPSIDMKSNTESAKRLNKFNLSDAFNMSSSLVQKVNIEIPKIDSLSGKRKMDISCGSFELHNTRQNKDVASALEELKDPQTETSPAPKSAFNIHGRKSLSSKGKNVISTSETGDMDVQMPQKIYKETSLTTKFDSGDVDMVENVTRSPSAVVSDLQKSSNQNLKIKEPTGGSTSKSNKRKSTADGSTSKSLKKKSTAEGSTSDSVKRKSTAVVSTSNSVQKKSTSVTKKNTVNKKDLTFLNNNEPSNDETENMSANKFLSMDDETEPPEDKDESNKEKFENLEPENTADEVMEEKTKGDLHDVDQHNDENDPIFIKNNVLADKSDDIENIESETTSRGRLTKKGKKKTANADVETDNVVNKKRNINKRVSVKEVNDVKPVNKKSKRTSGRCDLETQEENKQESSGKKEVVKAGKDNSEKNVDTTRIDVVKDEPMSFILTGPKLQRKEFVQIIKSLKGRVCRVSHQWSYQATHYIVPHPIRRNEKFFAAAASGRWILKTDYLSESNQAGKFLPEEPYEWHKNGLSEDGQIYLEAPRKWRLLKEKTGHGAFYGMRIIIHGECIAPTLDTLKRVVKAGDGTMLATSPPYTRFLNTGIDFAVVSPGMPRVDIWVQEFIKHEIPCVYADYLVDYVCKPGYPLEKHVQYDTNVWAERSYKKLNKQLEEDISEPRTPESDDVACEVCGSRDRGDEMLICGDEKGLIGCGAGTHIDCCDPPLDDVPEDDWFCVKCSKKPKGKKSIKRKVSAFRG